MSFEDFKKLASQQGLMGLQQVPSAKTVFSIYNREALYQKSRTIVVAVHGANSSYYTWRNLLAHPSLPVVAFDAPICMSANSNKVCGGGIPVSKVATYLSDILQNERFESIVFVSHSFGWYVLPFLPSCINDKIIATLSIAPPVPESVRPDIKILRNLFHYAYDSYENLTSIDIKTIRTINLLKNKFSCECNFQNIYPSVNFKSSIQKNFIIEPGNDRVLRNQNYIKMNKYLKNIEIIRCKSGGHNIHEEHPEIIINLLESHFF